LTAISAAAVADGHVAGWVGVGGPGEGPNGTDEWIQVGYSGFPSIVGSGMDIYYEVARPGGSITYHSVFAGLGVGTLTKVTVLEIHNRPNWWRVWVNHRAASPPIYLPASDNRWSPIATAESWDGGDGVCNSFSFRFEQVSVSHGRGGSWFEFKPGYHFLDGNYTVRTLASADGGSHFARRITGAGAGPDPYAFLASSS
jgi:hypothetical protein